MKTAYFDCFSGLRRHDYSQETGTGIKGCHWGSQSLDIGDAWRDAARGYPKNT